MLSTRWGCAHARIERLLLGLAAAAAVMTLARPVSGWLLRASYPAAVPPAEPAAQQRARQVAALRASCVARELPLRTQLIEHDAVLAHCEPPDRLAPPCILEELFALPVAAGEQRRDRFAQCRVRKTYGDWYAEPPAVPDRLKSAVDVSRLVLQPAAAASAAAGRITLVGSSLAQQIFEAAQCNHAAHDLERDPRYGRRWVRWGWSHFASDNGGCDGLFSFDVGLYPSPQHLFDKVQQAGCTSRGGSWAATLAKSAVVLLAYNPQHYNGLLGWWEADLRALLPQLQAFAARPGKAAVLLEPFATHFAHGSFWRSDGTHWPDVLQLRPEPACCAPILPGFERANFVYECALAMRRLRDELAPDVRLLPLYNATLPHHDRHKADSCSYSNRKVRGVAPPVGRRANASQLRVRECCDCLHFCFSPAFYDELVFTPLHALLKNALQKIR